MIDLSHKTIEELTSKQLRKLPVFSLKELGIDVVA